jgi:biopolymer transport protein ExbB
MKKITILALVSFLLIFVGTRNVCAQEAGGGGKSAVATADAKSGEAATAEGSTSSGSHKNLAKMDLITVITRAGWFGVVIWIGLFASLACFVWLVVDSYMTIREKLVIPESLVNDVRQAMLEGDIIKAISFCDKNPGPLANVLKAGFTNVEEGFEVIQDMISVAADMENERILQKVTYLSVISNATPMLGLIGTVQGMIYAFFTLGTQEAGAAQQAMLALNISHGLWATAVGLGTSVPASIYFYVFKNRATRLILLMEAMTISLVKGLRNVEVVQG